MSDQDVFAGGDDTTTQPETTNSGDPAPRSDDVWADKLKDITNEHGEPKYKTIEDALEALAHSQKFIGTLKTEKQTVEERMAALEAELEKRESVEEVVNRLTGNNQPQDPKPQEPNADPQKGATLDESKVLELVQQALSKESHQRTTAQNVSMVSDHLTNKYGEEANKMLRQRAKELNTTVQALKELSGTNPQLVLGLFADGGVVSNQSTTSSQRTGFPQKQQLELPKLEKRLMSGASDAEVKEAMRRIKEYTYKKLGVEE